MPALLLLVVLLVPLLAGCGLGGVRIAGVPTVDAPFTLTALDVGQSAFPFRCMRTVVRCVVLLQAMPTLKSAQCAVGSSATPKHRNVKEVPDADRPTPSDCRSRTLKP